MRISEWSSDVCSSDIIAYDGNGLVRPVRKFVGNSKAQCGADRCGATGCTERIICALGALGEPGKPTPLPQGADAVAPSCKNFVRIALMADIPDQPVMRCVERSEEHTSELQSLMR